MIISCPSCGASFNVKPEALGPTGRSVKCSKCAHRWHANPDGTELDPDFDSATAQPEAFAAEPVTEPTDTTVEGADAEETGETEPTSADGYTGDIAGFEDTTEGTGDIGTADPSTEPDAPPGLEAALGLAVADVDDDDEDALSRRGRRRNRPSSTPRKGRRGVAKVFSFFVLLLLIAGIGGTAYFLNQKIMMWMPATQRLYAMVGIKPQVLGQGLQIVEPTPKKEIDGNDEILIVEGEIRNTTAKPIAIPLMRGALLDKQGKELHIWTFTAAKSNVAPGENAPYRTEFRNPPTNAESLDITFTRANEVKGMTTQEVKMEAKPDGMPKEKKPDAMPKENMTKDGEKAGSEKAH